MPSLFSRARTFSTPKKSAAPTSDLDEFGRVATPAAHSAQRQRLRPKRTRRREGNHGLRQNHPNVPGPRPTSQHYPLRRNMITGYLSYERHVVLGLDELERLLDVVADELETRGGITTPFVFSNTALDISPSGIKRLIHSFLNTCVARNQQEAQVADLKWREEARFVGPHELGMTLRWALARVIRSVGGQDVRGIISYDQYVDFRDSEAANNYPANHFQTTFLPSLPPTLQYIVLRAHPSDPFSLIWTPFLWPGSSHVGLPPLLTFIILRSVNAFEHLLLAFVRWQDTPRSATGSATSLGVPARLKEWIKGYPSMLPFTNPKAKPQPRKGARTVRVMSVRRNSGSSWAHKLCDFRKNGSAFHPPTLKLPPRYSDPYKKKMNLANNFHPDVDPHYFATEERKDARFRSLTDLKWGEFESMGFDNLGDDKKLQFDLTESARQERAAKRQTLTPLINTVQQWPTQQVEMHKKLKKQAKALPSFGWDTEPVIEEAFIDVFCDLVYGGGWMDLERGESLDRDCNWALYRQQLALPSKSRRRLPSLFSTSSRKQWKQAATLNGRPYVVGHVPRSPGYRELEFEGLLQGASGTKVLSLSAKRDSMKVPPKFNTMNSSKAQPDIPRLAPPRQLPPAMSGSPVVASPTQYTPDQVDHLAPRSDEMPSDSSATPSGHKKSRFRLPVSPSVRRSMMGPPAEYSTVEFQTRMASYSDDELNAEDDDEPEDVKQKRRESRPDAWVDILDPAERRRARMRKSDPDMASLEVAQVLAQVQGRSPSPQSIPDMLSERSHRVDGGSYGISQHIYEDSDVDLVEKVPRAHKIDRSPDDKSSEGPADADDEDDELMAPILNARQMAKEQRRLGYFDLHPERRPKAATPPPVEQQEEDPRDRFARDSMSEEGIDDDDDINTPTHPPEPRRPLPPPPLVTIAPLTPSKSPSPPAARVVPDIKIVTEAPPTPEKPKLSPPNTNGHAVDALPKPRTPTGGSRTAALIEMYREKERGTTASPAAIHVPTIPVAPLNISRIPVRNASLPAPPAPPAPAASSSVAPRRFLSLRPSPPQPTDFVPPPSIDDPSLGRASPARYVHGAPLHNVLEEEEEEE
ncbi:hypothetical protein BKA70DRAFT_1387504 [Coprinopsis sp. MPI-PUGE-AT-0042]|nr:hypothetical protein BKA70DRAFT_1387504 [Coprinopsis sp. MPI-PUGE-AT-0042]